LIIPNLQFIGHDWKDDDTDWDYLKGIKAYRE